MTLPTGEQYVLSREGPLGEVTAVVTELAAGVRRLSVGGVELVQDYPAGSLPSSASGIVLMPWPNRVAGGKWTLDGAVQQLDITEPKYGNASHGLLRNTGYQVTDQSASAITLSATVFPQHGYPFHLDTSVRYQLTEDGVTVMHGVHNAGEAPAPFGVGTHPFLRVGDTPARQLTVTVLADRYYEVDERKIPVRALPVDGTPFDLRGGRSLADADLDTAFTGLRTIEGRFRHRLTAPDGRGVELWASRDFGTTQVFVTDVYATDDGLIDAVAIEPMTCAPNALNSGDGLIWLDPDDQWIGDWGIRLI